MRFHSVRDAGPYDLRIISKPIELVNSINLTTNAADAVVSIRSMQSHGILYYFAFDRKLFWAFAPRRSINNESNFN
jgi:hypothetical protein